MSVPSITDALDLRECHRHSRDPDTPAACLALLTTVSSGSRTIREVEQCIVNAIEQDGLKSPSTKNAAWENSPSGRTARRQGHSMQRRLQGQFKVFLTQCGHKELGAKRNTSKEWLACLISTGARLYDVLRANRELKHVHYIPTEACFQPQTPARSLALPAVMRGTTSREAAEPTTDIGRKHLTTALGNDAYRLSGGKSAMPRQDSVLKPPKAIAKRATTVYGTPDIADMMKTAATARRLKPLADLNPNSVAMGASGGGDADLYQPKPTTPDVRANTESFETIPSPLARKSSQHITRKRQCSLDRKTPPRRRRTNRSSQNSKSSQPSQESQIDMPQTKPGTAAMPMQDKFVSHSKDASYLD